MRGISLVVGPLLLLLCAGVVTSQFLVRPAVGIASNGDVPKMAGPVALGPETGHWESHMWVGFYYSFAHRPEYLYNSPFWTAPFVSCELLLVELATAMQEIVQPGPRFDIRWLGGVHAILFLAGFGIWIYALAPRWRLYTGLLAVLIWTDVAYVQYLNSFYQDAAAIVFLVLCGAAGLYSVQRPNSRAFPVITVCTAALFAVSKAQHAFPALVLLPFFLSLAYWRRGRWARGVWMAGSVLLALAVGAMVHRTGDEFRSRNVFNMVFWRLAMQSPEPGRVLEEVGLGAHELVYVGTTAYSPNGLAWDPEWIQKFRSRCNYVTLFRYYFHHPVVVARFSYHDLAVEASKFQPFANRSLDDGFKPNSRSDRFRYWSDFRSFLLKHAPWHVILLALLTLAAATWLLRSPPDRQFAALVLTIQTLAIAEFAISVLADALETDRHLLIFNLTTDLSILLLPLLISRIVTLRTAQAIP